MRSGFERHPQVRRVGDLFPQNEWIVSGVNGRLLVSTTWSTTHPFVVNPCDERGTMIGPDEPVAPQDVESAIRYALDQVGAEVAE